MLPGPIDGAAAASALRSLRSGGLEEKPSEVASFAEVAGSVLRGANQAQNEAHQQAQALAGEEGDIVEALLAMSRADLSLRFVVSLRNRALDAYNEIMRLQV